MFNSYYWPNVILLQKVHCKLVLYEFYPYKDGLEQFTNLSRYLPLSTTLNIFRNSTNIITKEVLYWLTLSIRLTKFILASTPPRTPILYNHILREPFHYDIRNKVMPKHTYWYQINVILLFFMWIRWITDYKFN